MNKPLVFLRSIELSASKLTTWSPQFQTTLSHTCHWLSWRVPVQHARQNITISVQHGVIITSQSKPNPANHWNKTQPANPKTQQRNKTKPSTTQPNARQPSPCSTNCLDKRTFGYWRNLPHFIKTVASLLEAQQPAMGTYPQQNENSTHPPTLIEDPF